VLSARPTDAEAQFSFGALVDLLDEVDTKEVKNLPAPQRRALDVDPASRGTNTIAQCEDGRRGSNDFPSSTSAACSRG